jgi:hypothetical protein
MTPWQIVSRLEGGEFKALPLGGVLRVWPLLPMDFRHQMLSQRLMVKEIMFTRAKEFNARLQLSIRQNDLRFVNEQVTYFGGQLSFGSNTCFICIPEFFTDDEYFREIEQPLMSTVKRLVSVAFLRPIGVEFYFLRTPKAENKRAGYVYLLGSEDGYSKIGRAKNVSKRLEQIKLQMPFKLRLIHTIRVSDCVWAESYLHKKFRHARKNGKWFKLSDTDIRWIKSLTTLEPEN